MAVLADDAAIKGAAYDPALDGDGTYRGFPAEFDGRYPKGMPSGEGWKVLSGDGWLATSKCIGSFESPECIMDTVMACEVWSKVVGELTHRVGDFVSGGKWHPICGKLEYANSEPETAFYWRHVFHNPGLHSEDLVRCYRNSRFVYGYFESDEKRLEAARLCTDPIVLCRSDVVVVLLSLDCEQRDNVRLDDRPEKPPYEPGRRIDYCKRTYLELALFARKKPGEESWSMVQLFDPGGQGSIYRGWDELEEVYQGMR